MKKLSQLQKKYLFWGIILFFWLIYSCALQKVYLFPDSNSYMNYPFDIFGGNGRTPIYPAFLKICFWVFGENYLRYVSYIQLIVSFVSLFFFRRAIAEICTNNKVQYILTGVYALSTCIFGWNFDILTESFALSGTTIWSYYFIKFIKSKGDEYPGINIVLLLVLVFLRPSFLLLWAGFIVVAILLNLCIGRKRLRRVNIFAIVSFVLIIGYSFAFYQANGIFSISNPLPRQLMYVAIQRDYYKDNPDKEFVNYVECALSKFDKKEKGLWPVTHDVVLKYGYNKTQTLAKSSIRHNLPRYIEDERKLSVGTMKQRFHAYMQPKKDNNKVRKVLHKVLNKFGRVFNWLRPLYSIIIAGIMFLLVGMQLMKKKLDLLTAYLSGAILLIFLTTMIATNAEFIRTMIHIIPLTYLGIAVLFEYYLSYRHQKDITWLIDLKAQ